MVREVPARLQHQNLIFGVWISRNLEHPFFIGPNKSGKRILHTLSKSFGPYIRWVCKVFFFAENNLFFFSFETEAEMPQLATISLWRALNLTLLMEEHLAAIFNKQQQLTLFKIK